jgi:hypothetical protein
VFHKQVLVLAVAVASGVTSSVAVSAAASPGNESPLSRHDTLLPVVSSVSPDVGGEAGGTRVLIEGQNLSGTRAVDFGENLATFFEVHGDQTIVATSPPGSGTVDVTVSTSSGTSQVTGADSFTYLAPLPSVRRVTPSRGSESGETPVTILGSNFHDATAVRFGAVAALGVTVDSNHEITAVSPPGTGTVDVTVTTSGGISTTSSKDRFTYGFPTPSVTFIKPTRGDMLGGTNVKIVGAGFSGATDVDFGSTPAARFEVDSDHVVTAKAPEGTGTVDVTVITPFGKSATTATDEFTYLVHPPIVRTLLPNSGSPDGGTGVTISGANFQDATAVDFGGVPARSFEINSPTSISASSPAGTGTVDVTVTTPQGTSALNSSDQFTYSTRFFEPRGLRPQSVGA